MDIEIIGAATNLGANRIGVESGFAILDSKLNLATKFDRHIVANCSEIKSESFVNVHSNDSSMKNREEIFEFNTRLANKVENALFANHFPIIIGGDHVLSWGSISGIAAYYQDLGCIYIDAHGDFNTAEISPSHNVHGMHMAYLMGLVDSEYVNFYKPGVKLKKDHVFFVGTRSLDEGEKKYADSNRLNIQTSEDILELGVENVTNNLLQKISECNLEHYHISLDIDVLDPLICPGTGVPEPHGITLKEVLYILEKLLLTGKIVSIDVVEFNPLLDIEDKTLHLCSDIFNTINRNLL